MLESTKSHIDDQFLRTVLDMHHFYSVLVFPLVARGRNSATALLLFFFAPANLFKMMDLQYARGKAAAAAGHSIRIHGRFCRIKTIVCSLRSLHVMQIKC